jgi:hypothetical protein
MKHDLSNKKYIWTRGFDLCIDLYFDRLSLRKTSKTLSRFVRRSHTAIRNIQKYQTSGGILKERMISECIIEETLIKVGSDYIRLGIAMEPKKQADVRTFVKIH